MASVTQERKFKVGVIGYGMSAKIFHIPFINHTKGLVLDAIVQRRPSQGDSAPEDHPTVKHYTTVEALVNDPAIDVVVVSTPPNTHYSFTHQAITAGKHVLVEKPFVPTSAEADELVALAREHNRLLCVYQNRRWDGDFVTVQALLRDGTLGRVVELETHYDRLRPERPSTWKGQLRMSSGGGAIYDLGTHLLDQVFVLFGMPSDVTGRFVNQRLGKIVRGDEEDDALEPDSVKALLAYADRGLFVEVRIGVLCVETQQLRFWVRGTKGAYDKRGVDPQEDQLKAGMAVTDPRFGREDAKWQGRLRLTVGENNAIEERPWPNVDPPATYLKFYDLFAKALASGREEDVPVPASEAAQVLRIIEAIRKSAVLGTSVSPSS